MRKALMRKTLTQEVHSKLTALGVIAMAVLLCTTAYTQTRKTQIAQETASIKHTREYQDTNKLQFLHATYLENNFIKCTDGSLWILEDFEGYVGDSLLIAYDANDTISKIDDIIIDYTNIKLQGGFMQWQD